MVNNLCSIMLSFLIIVDSGPPDEDFPLLTLLADFGGWPVLSGGEWDVEGREVFGTWQDTMIKMRRKGLAAHYILDVGITSDLKNTTQRIIEVDFINIYKTFSSLNKKNLAGILKIAHNNVRNHDSNTKFCPELEKIINIPYKFIGKLIYSKTVGSQLKSIQKIVVRKILQILSIDPNIAFRMRERNFKRILNLKK